jgi:hypothetical protein
MSKFIQAFAIFFTAWSFSTAFGEGQIDGTDPRFDSRYLIKAGERAKDFVLQKIEALSVEEQTNNGTHLELIDARDPRLYGSGQPIQPPFPAELALVRVGSNGQMRILSLVLDRPGYFAFKSFPSGGFIFSVSTSVEFLSYDGKNEGTFASVGRSTSGRGWIYNPYVRGMGNEVSSDQFDVAVSNFLARYVYLITQR